MLTKLVFTPYKTQQEVKEMVGKIKQALAPQMHAPLCYGSTDENELDEITIGLGPKLHMTPELFEAIQRYEKEYSFTAINT